MTTIADIVSFIHQTLITSEEYKQLCIDTISSELNYFESTPVLQDYDENRPYLTVTSESDEVDELSQNGINSTFNIIVSIGIEPTVNNTDNGYEYTTINDVKVYEDKTKVHKLMIGAYNILKKKSWTCGINQEDIKLIGRQSTVSEIGEVTELVLGIMKLQFIEQTTLTEEWQ